MMTTTGNKENGLWLARIEYLKERKRNENGGVTAEFSLVYFDKFSL